MCNLVFLFHLGLETLGFIITAHTSPYLYCPSVTCSCRYIQQPHNKKRKFSCVLYAYSQFFSSLASFKLLTLGVCHPSRIPSLLDYYSTTHSRSLIFLQLWCLSTALYVALRVFYSTVLCAALYFCCCELRWHSTVCVLLPCFKAFPAIFAVTDCLELSAVFCSGLLTWSADNNLCSLQWHNV